MAEVFKAKSHGVEGFEKVLVIKRILPELSENPEFVDMFINEAKIAVTLSHANIVQVFDLGRADNTYFIAMEYVAGLDLATVLRRGQRFHRPLPPELAVYVASELAKGLDYAHRRRDADMQPLNIVHRDVSPQNVLLSYEGEVKLTDFGIAKARTTVDQTNELGVVKGKYAYMAPEQATGNAVDGRSDLFALGTVLYEALSGTNPFLAPSTYDTLQRVRSGVAPALKDAAPHVTDELGTIVARAMAPDPQSRHPNAGRFYEDLIQFLYASGRRVGAHDLADYLSALRQASEAAGQTTDHDRILEAFEEEAGRVRAAHATPVEVPGRSSTRRSSVTPGRRVSASGIAIPRAERRDVTALAVRTSAGDRGGEAPTASIVQRFGGTVVSDAPHDLVALFGARDPDGRDTEAAARCALRLAQAAASIDAPPARIALHSGRVLVDMAGNLVKDETHAALVTTVRNLAQSASKGDIVASASASKILRGKFELSPATDPSGSQVLTAELSSAATFGKFIGRRNELRRMGEVLALANRGKLRVLGVFGEPGCGKTRLLHETIRRLRLGGHDVGMHLASCSVQNRDVPLGAVQEMMKVVLGIEDPDPEPIVREKLGRLRELGLTQAELAAVGGALGISMEPYAQPRTRPLRAAVLHIVTKLAEDRLTVFAWDGAESMDDESQALIDALLRGARDAKVAVVLAYRPGFVHAWRDLPGYHELEVPPLSDEEVARLTGARLGGEEVPHDLLREVTAKSAGNPLYVEEYIKALIDAGAVDVAEGKVVYHHDVAEVEVPKTLRGMVSSRIARLGPTQRHILQIAAIAGARFGPELVATVSGEKLGTVTAALGVLERRGVVVQYGPSEYAFAHDLVREVVRDSLTVEARRELHGAVGAALEELYPDSLDEMAERLAHHYRESGDRARSVDYLERAASRLESEHALDGSIANIARAIELLQQIASPDRDRVLGLYRRIGDLAYRSRALEAGAERMAAALELAESLGRDEYVARFSMMRGRLLVNATRFEEGRRWLDRARDMARRIGDRELLRDVALATAEADTRNGEHAHAIGSLREALAISRETGDVAAQIRCLIPLSLSYATTGNQQSGLRSLEEARRLAGAKPDRFTECELLKMESLVHYYARDHRGTIIAAERALELAKEYGFSYECAVNAHNMGEAYVRLGDFKRAFTFYRYSYEIAREHGLLKLQMINMRMLGFIDALKFGSEEGRTRMVQAIDYAAEQGHVWDIIEGSYLLALIDHMRGDRDSARRGLQRVLRLAAEHGHRRSAEDAQSALQALDEGKPVPLPS